ncbi:MAG: imidazole glycerol phosphate synthase subunit HisH, partial [Thermodesulfobacteriota bacterium]
MIAIVDYDAGNLTSVARAMAHLGYDCDITKDETRIRNAERVIFPGVGAAGSAMASLRRLGLDRAIQETFASGKPLLGICLGTQIIMGFSEEDGGVDCLGIVAGRTRLFSNRMTDAAGAHLKIPHMGW